MAKDLGALKTALETDAIYDAAVVGGSNNEILRLLHAPSGSLPKRWHPIAVDDFLDAIAGETLTAEQEERIRTYTQNRDMVPVHKANVRTWCIANFSASALTALQVLSQQDGRPIDAFFTDDDTTISKQEIRQVVVQISKAFAHPDQEVARVAEKAPKIAAETAQRESIEAAVIAGYPDTIRQVYQDAYTEKDDRVYWEVRAQVRVARGGTVDG
jgi:hypothetical protein